jgi:hypothetical protein
MQDTVETPAEPGSFLGHTDIVAYRNAATGHEHGEADGLVREGWLTCAECIAAADSRTIFGWSRPSFYGLASTDGKETALRPPPPPPVYRSRRERSGVGRG